MVEVRGRLVSVDGSWVWCMMSRDGDVEEYERFVSEMAWGVVVQSLSEGSPEGIGWSRDRAGDLQIG